MKLGVATSNVVLITSTYATLEQVKYSVRFVLSNFIDHCRSAMWRAG